MSKPVTTGLELRLNGRKVRRAGLSGEGGVILILESVIEPRAKTAKSKAALTGVGQADPKRDRVERWSDLRLRSGDLLEIRVLDAGPFDKPSKVKVYELPRGLQRTDADLRRSMRHHLRRAKELQRELDRR